MYVRESFGVDLIWIWLEVVVWSKSALNRRKSKLRLLFSALGLSKVSRLGIIGGLIAGMIQSLFLLSPTGEVLIERHFRGVDTDRSVCNSFWSIVAEQPHHPVLEIPTETQGTLYVISIRKEGVSYLAVCAQEVPPLMILELLHRMANIFHDYFGNADETAITDNFSLVYQLLEEMIDHGHPMTFEENALKAMIRPPSVMDKLMNNTSTVVSDSLPSGAVSNMPWRTAAHYQNNEIYVDMLEEVDAIIDSRGNVVSSHVRGSIQCRSQLSGTPDLLLTFNDPSIIGDDCSFHPCVRYTRFEKERVVSFVPPDGNFELMRYRVHQSQAFVPPVQCTAQWGSEGRLSLQVAVTSLSGLVFSASAARNKVVEELAVAIPFPKGTLFNTSDISVSMGSFVFDESSKVLQWNVGKTMDTSQKATLTCKFTLGDPSPVVEVASLQRRRQQVTMSERRRRLCEQQQPKAGGRQFSPPNISLSWNIPLASVSGLSVSGLSLLHERYRPYKGVRNVTAAGPYYQVRCNS